VKRSKPMRRTRIKPSNTERKAKRFAANFGSEARVRWVNSHECLCRGKHPACSGRTVNAHVTSRGAGGKAEDIVPLSWFCHQWQGNHGWADWHKLAQLEPGHAERVARRMSSLGPDAPRPRPEP
jgi:hypothetical protein